ncbi:MAG: hypothetical protein LBJ72_09025 [Dysgonamonadaceae bacterium]|jgi:hypothetical protein|nr:hypothetical protein [Dysgonamonadaceae bacterium]
MEVESNYKEYKTESREFSGKKKKIFIGRNILDGEILKEDFVVKQSKLIILITFLFVLFISNRYSCLKKLTEIDRLKTELKDIKYENLVISTQLTTNSRQSQIESLIEEKGLNLSGSKTPAYEIRK